MGGLIGAASLVRFSAAIADTLLAGSIMQMLILGSGSDPSQGREWFLVAAPHTSRVFLVVRTAAETSVRWLIPNVAWHQLEPASAVETDEAKACVAGREADGSLAWNDVEHATAIWRLFKEGNAAQ